MLKEKKGAFVWLGTAKQDQDPVWPLHNSRFDVDEDILWRGFFSVSADCD